MLFLILILASILRLFSLGSLPPSLYWDEASLGYNAYSIAQSLKDEHGEFLPIDRFIAFGDYKPPGFIYAAALSVKFLGLDEVTIRLTSALAGIFLVYLTFLASLEIFGSRKIGLLAALFVSISPWSLHLSRGAFEANLAASFNLAGIYFFLKGRRNGFFLLPSFLFFILSFYTFNANRIIAPVLISVFSLIFLKEIKSKLNWLAAGFLLTILLLLPSLSFLRSRESRLRMQEVSIFTSLVPIEEANQRIKLAGNSLVARILHNRRLLFAGDYLKHYFDNFSGRFLFTQGDANPRIHVQGMGELYYFDLLPVLTGLYLLIRKPKPIFLAVLAWAIVVPLPAAVARETPHALRIVSILPVYQLLTAAGLLHLLMLIKKKAIKFLKPVVLITVFLFVFNTSLYLHNYYLHFARDWSGEWQYGYKEMVQFVLARTNNYNQIFVTQALGTPYIYFAFYKPFTNEEFLRERKEDRDWYGFYNVTSLGKIKFGLESMVDRSGKTLLVLSEGNLPDGFRTLKRIYDFSGRQVFVIGEKI